MMSDCLIVIGILFYCHSVILIEALKKYVTHLLLLFDAMKMVQVDVVAIEFDKAHAFSSIRLTVLSTGPDHSPGKSFSALISRRGDGAWRRNIDTWSVVPFQKTLAATGLPRFFRASLYQYHPATVGD